MQSFLRWLPTVLASGVAVGTVLGAVRGARFASEGYPLLWLDLLRQEIVQAVGLALVGALAWALCWLVTRRFRGAGWRLPLAAGLALAPTLAAIGYRLNRARGVSPRELFSISSLEANGPLLALAALAWIAITWVGRRRRPPPLRQAATRTVAGIFALGLFYIAVGASFRLLPPTGGGRPAVIVLLVDVLRADHVGIHGYTRPTTPAIDAFAADAVVFDQAVSQSTFTKTSVASLFTGRYPYRHGVYWGSRASDGRWVADVLGDGETVLAEVLREHGYLTTAWVQNTHLVGEMGFAQGFVDYRDQQGSIERIHRSFRRFLAGPAHRYPFFAYLHYIDLHDPYLPEPPWKGMFGTYSDVYAGVDLAEWGNYLNAVRTGDVDLSDADVEQLIAYYDGQLRYIDERIGRLLEELVELDLYDDSVIVFTSDHGDAFMEHGFISHSATPYEELVRVPLMIKLPGNRFAGHRVADQVRLVDLLPTVLDAAGVGDMPEGVDGCSLMPLIRGAGYAAPRCAVAVTEIAEDDGYPTVAVRAGGLKYIHRQLGPDELYDLGLDPQEQEDLIASPEYAQAAVTLRRRALEAVEQRSEAGERIELDAATIDELRALGYVGQ